MFFFSIFETWQFFLNHETRVKLFGIMLLGFSLVSALPRNNVIRHRFQSAFASSSPEEGEGRSAKRACGAQIFGIATYDALLKYIMSQDSIRPSFFHAFVPGLTITSSTRLDEHMNPLQEFQISRDFIHDQATARMVRRISSNSGTCLGTLGPNSGFVKDEAATTFFKEMIGHFEEIKRAFPAVRYDGTMDFVCLLDTGEYALVEMQVIPQDYWDQRALAYVAAFYGNQLRRGDKWGRDLKKVIGVNILGGGKDDNAHWKDTDQYVRIYKFQEQLHEMGGKRYIDGIELIQYNIMNAPEDDSTSDSEKKDWITFFKRGHRMTEDQVGEQIKTTAVLEAFQMAKLSSLPKAVKAAYENEDINYDAFSQHTQELVDEAVNKTQKLADEALKKAQDEAVEAVKKAQDEAVEALKKAQDEAVKKGKLMARAGAMKSRGVSDAEIATTLGLTAADVSSIDLS
jgi:predicted transposase/invertase (TIGR01784 family)